MHKRLLFVSVSILVLGLVASCGGSSEQSNTMPAASGGAPSGGGAVPAATATLAGKVVFEGTPPPNEKIQMSSDPYCKEKGGPNPTLETVKVSDGGLEDVILYVKTAPAGVTYPTPTQAVEIDQQNCHYIPHVFTIQTNQPLKVKNSDSTLHNIHAWAVKNPQFNVGQPVKDMVNETKFATEEIPLPIKCDVHKWMNSFVGVFAHPYHTVSKSAGSYELKLPAGNYEIVAWHEKYGTQTQMVEVKDNEKKDLNFTFKADSKPTD